MIELNARHCGLLEIVRAPGGRASVCDAVCIQNKTTSEKLVRGARARAHNMCVIMRIVDTRSRLVGQWWMAGDTRSPVGLMNTNSNADDGDGDDDSTFCDLNARHYSRAL